MPIYRTQAIVMHSLPYGEVDKIVTLYTLDFGKIKGIAKGAKRSRRRFGNILEICSYILLSFFEKESGGLVRLSHGELISSFEGLRENIHKLAWASYFLELVNEMTAERVPNQQIFYLLLAGLKIINRGKLQEEIIRIFEMRLLAHSGYQPFLDCCLRCRKNLTKEGGYFSPEEGGIICLRCGQNLPNLIPVSLGTIKTLILAQNLPLERINRLNFSAQSLRESAVVLSLFLGKYLGKELKSKKFFDQLSLSSAS